MSRVSKVTTLEQAMAKIKDGDRIMVGGFGLRGCPDDLIDALVASNKKELIIISNDLGAPGIGLGKLLSNQQIKALIGNFYNWNPEVAEARNAGKIKVTLIPQGSFAESIRAAGCGIPAYFTLAAAGTELAAGKEVRQFNGRQYVLEEAIHADVALIKAETADELGNLVYCKSARNFNPAMATAAQYTVVQAGEIVRAGELDPECIVTPHLFVQAIVKEGISRDAY
ncbi:MAG: CoA transferase subunit A [Sporomusaceae bacterium]|nr:CoA transferase subunit A [Sporomusaceae bacterium]